MAKILKPVQSEGGFSVSEESIIDANRNILKANSVEVVNSSYLDANKKEFITFNTATDVASSVNLDNLSTVQANEIIFSKSTVLLTWKGYVLCQYNVASNSTIVRLFLDSHGVSLGDSVTVAFGTPWNVNDGTYTVSNVLSPNVFEIDTGVIFDSQNSILGETVELQNFGFLWEYSAEVSTTCLSDSSNTLSLAGVSKIVVKDNVPKGHSWDVFPIINNESKTFGYQVSITSNGTLELHSNGVDCVGLVSNVSAIRQ